MAKTMFSWQAFPSSLPPSLLVRPYSLAPKTPFPILFKRLPRRLSQSPFQVSAAYVVIRETDLQFSGQRYDGGGEGGLSLGISNQGTPYLDLSSRET